MSQCKVWLDNYTGQYFPGNQIQGKVILNFNSETTLRGIKVRVVAHEHTEWMGTETYHDPATNKQETRSVLLQGNNDAFHTEIVLHGGYSGTTTLPLGQHIYPFSISLPNLLPGSYACEHGSITFKLIAKVDRPMALDYEDQLIFVVVSPVDLNTLGRTDLNEPTQYSEDKTVCCLCCAQGPISLDVDFPKKSIVPGETVNVTVRLTNMSNTNIEGLDCKLKQIIACKVDHDNDRRYVENVIVELHEVGLGAHGEHTYTFPVMLPVNVIIPNFALCSLFTVEYKCKVVAKLPGVHSNLEVEMHPVVGNIALGQPPSGFQIPSSDLPPQYPPAGGNGYQPYPPSTRPSQGYPPAGDQYPPEAGQYPPMAGQYAPAAGQYPPATAQYPAVAGQYSPAAGQYPPAAGQYPPAAGQYPPMGAQYPPAGGQYPAAGASAQYPPSLPTAPGGYHTSFNPGFASKAEEAAGPPSAPSAYPESSPPSYDSVSTPK